MYTQRHVQVVGENSRQVFIAKTMNCCDLALKVHARSLCNTAAISTVFGRTVTIAAAFVTRKTSKEIIIFETVYPNVHGATGSSAKKQKKSVLLAETDFSA